MSTFETSTEMSLEQITEVVRANAARVAELGKWPPYMNPTDSLVSRIPVADKTGPGFDAGIAAALDLIPRDKQCLAATLHGAYTPDAVEQVRREAGEMGPDSETCWWMAASHLCGEEGEITQQAFLKQLEQFRGLVADAAARRDAALAEFQKMTTSFETTTYGIPFGTQDGCMQGAYLAGHPFAAMYSEKYGIYFIGTYLPDLGLDGFVWSEEKDENGRAKSGPVFGSKQFVKAADEKEFLRVVAVVKQHLGGK